MAKKTVPIVGGAPKDYLTMHVKPGHPLHGAGVGSRHHLGLETKVTGVSQGFGGDKDWQSVSMDVHGMKYHRAGKAAAVKTGSSGSMVCPMCGATGTGPYCADDGERMKPRAA